MARLGALTIDIAADIAQLRRDMGKATSIVSKNSRDMERRARAAGKAVGAIAGALVGGLAVRGIARMVEAQREAIDQSAKFADVIGTTTEEFAGLQLGAKISGVELGQLNTGLQRFLKNVGDAGDGLQAPIRALDKLGLSFKDLEGLTTNEQLKLVADRFKGLDSSVDKASVALTLFGRSGINITKLLETGSEGIERFAKEAGDLGIAISRVDAAAIEDANDALTRAGEASSAFGKNLTVELAPTLKTIGDEFVNIARDSGGFKELARDLGEFFKTIVDEGRDTVFLLRLMASEIDRISTLAPLLAKTAAQSINPFDDVSSQQAQIRFRTEANKLAKQQKEDLAKLVDQMLKVREDALKIGETPGLAESGSDINLDEGGVSGAGSKAAAAAATIFNQTRTAAEKYEAQVESLQTLLAAGELTQDTYNRAIEQYATQLAKANPELQAYNKQQAEGKRIFEATRTPLENLYAEYARLQKLFDAGAIQDVDTYHRAIADAAEGFQKLQKDSEDTGTSLDVFADQAARNMQDAFAEFLFDPFDDGLRGMVEGFLRAIQRMVAEAAAAEVFSAFNKESSTSGDSESSGLGNVFGSFLKGLFTAEGGGFTGTGMRAGGIDGRGGMLAVLHPNETVVDHTRGQRTGGAVNVVQNFNGIDGNYGLTKTARSSAIEVKRRLQYG